LQRFLMLRRISHLQCGCGAQAAVGVIMKTTADRLTLPNRHRSAPLMPILQTASSNELADLCRSAALGFLANAPDWDKRKLADWLQGSYRPLVIGAGYQRKLTPAYGSAPPPPVASTTIASILENAHAEVLRQLRDLAAASSSLDTGRAFISRNVVTRCIDDLGNAGWAPVSHRVSLLADRVMSLFAADFLARPWDYEYDLTICECCNNVSFSEVQCCRAHSGAQRIVRKIDSEMPIAKAS
jgi:hypothetical protein